MTASSKPKRRKPRNPMARAIAAPLFKPRVVAARKGKRAPYKRQAVRRDI